MKGLEQFLQEKQKLVENYSKVEKLNIFPVGDITLEDFNNKQADLINEHFFVSFTGQIKAGKSTLINALVFQDNILPADDLPETAKITIINYSEEKYFEVEFYSESEWEQLRNEELIVNGKSTNFFDAYIREDIKKLGKRVNDFISKPPLKESDITKLGSYVGNNGEYKPFVKLVNVYYPNEMLKDITFVDTPGVNDPNPVRSKVTKDWIYKTDANIFLTYAKQAMSEQDFDFIDEYLFSVASSKKITVVNKIDTIEGSLNDLKAYIKNLANDEHSIKRGIFGDEDSIVYTSALGGLIDFIEKSKGEFPDEFTEYTEHLESGEINYLDESNHNLLQLKEVIESKLIETKGNGLIESKSTFLNSIFNKKISVIEIKKSEINQRLGLYEKSGEELTTEKKRLKFMRSKINKLFEGVRATINKGKGSSVFSFSNTINKIKNEIIKDVTDELEKFKNTKHFKTEVKLTVKKAIEDNYSKFKKSADDLVEELGVHIEDNMRTLEQGLKDYNIMDFSLQSQLINLFQVDILHELDDIKTKVKAEMTEKIIEDYVNDNANWLQRLFDTEAGLKNIKIRLKDVVENFLELSLTKSFSGLIKNKVTEAIDTIFSELEKTTNEILDGQDDEISKIQNELSDNKQSTAVYKDEIIALEKTILELHNCKKDII